MPKTSRYSDVYRRSIEAPESFWAEQAEALDWFKRWDKVLDHASDAIPRWFVGGEINACYNCVDRHVEAGHGDDIALIYESPVTSTSRQLTYAALQEATSRVGGALRSLGVGKGDRKC
ncbi:acetyl-coenzyme A synthetase N-terminal domain-containing protein [Altererythrobacter sp. BO-6]|uniref:acetyl-coenzyme A synthetase N-terminal domain-containing protein n=1 Tax=Altererythrobacter sp. BO-6 TaxID=2604537 RepID=UPI002407EA7C|nr:acetyl-coenzyme A synthetase N-terminal domain-containing protein [Altererythrobacter sp. BO-6]